jgi:aminopeptidase
MIIRGTYEAMPVMREVAREAVRAGAHVHVRIETPEVDEIFFQEANERQLTYVSDLSLYELDYFNVLMVFMSATNTKYLSSVDPLRIQKAQAAQAELAKKYMLKVSSPDFKWCVSLCPTNALAQDAGMSLSQYENFVFSSCKLHADDPATAWRAVADYQAHIVEFLSGVDEIHIVAPDTDITYHTRGRKWQSADGRVNFPDGEVFTSPLEDSINGTVSFSYPAIYQGKEVEGVRLTVEQGKIVAATAARGEDFLNSVLDTDAGSRLFGEAAFGLNYDIQQFSRNVLFDEKIGGTMHMAVGAGFPHLGGQNESTVHWDMVCDLRQGKVYADGRPCYENGRFTI